MDPKSVYSLWYRAVMLELHVLTLTGGSRSTRTTIPARKRRRASASWLVAYV